MSEQIIAQLMEEKNQLVARIDALEKKVAQLEKVITKIEEHMKHPTDFRNV